MASDEAGEKSEQPTARRLQEARENGQVAKSMDLTAAVAMLGGLVLLQIFGAGIMESMLAMTREFGNPIDISGGEIKSWIHRTATTGAMMIIPFLLLLMLIVLAGSYLQSGLVFSWKKLMPDLKNISPAKGIKRIFSKDSVVKLLFGVAKMVLVGAVAYFTIVPRIGSVLGSGNAQPRGVLNLTLDLLVTVAWRLVMVLFLLGLIDYFYQRWSLQQQLKMTKQEVKDEMKRMEGDPLMKQRRRQVQAKIAMQRIGIDVPKADVVVTNPNEYSVAIRYDESSMPAPRVVAKGRDLLALRIRQVAQKHGIPIVQRPPLARALYASCEPGQEIPAEHFRAIAEVLAYVYQLDRAHRTAAAAS